MARGGRASSVATNDSSTTISRSSGSSSSTIKSKSKWRAKSRSRNRPPSSSTSNTYSAIVDRSRSGSSAGDYRSSVSYLATDSRASTSGSGISRPPSCVPSRSMTTSKATMRPYSAMSNRQAGHVVCAVSEGRGVAATVGLSFVSIDTGECVLCEIVDSQTYIRTIHKLTVYDPVEILVANSTVEPAKSKLCSIIEDNLPGAKLIPIARKYFNESIGHDYISQLSFPKDVESISVLIASKFFPVCALAAVMKHIEINLNLTFAAHSLRIRYEGSEGSMLIDYSTIRNLELIQNIANPKVPHSLLGILNNTHTPMGLRLLRSNILQPLTDAATLEARLDALEELTQNEELFFSCQSSLKPFQDLDRLLTSLISIPTKPSIKFSEQRINDIILLKQSISCIPTTAAAVHSCHSDLLVAIRELCAHESIRLVRNLIDECINEDCQWAKTPVELRNQRCFAVKQGRNGLLDVARRSYKEVTEDVMALIARMKEEYLLDDLESRFEIARGYYLRLSIGARENAGERPLLPEIFVNQVVVKRQYLECTTMELIKLNAKLRDALTEIMLMSDETVESLIENVRMQIPALYKACEGIAMLDMLVSFAHLTTASEKLYTRPRFDQSGPDGTGLLAVKDARHPIKEIVMMKKGCRFVENDVYASKETSRFQIITGTNMSGKSTYLKQVALLCIMAQIGSFVPAEHATFPIFRALHSRVSTDEGADAAISGPAISASTAGAGTGANASSTFSTDMREAAFILQNVTNHSLIIIDEMGRGSSVRDGLAITIAISEVLVDSNATIFFSTHFLEVAEILGGRVGVANLHMRVDMQDASAGGVGKLKMLYKIADGRNSSSPHYGLKLAGVLPFPRTMLRRATEIADSLAATGAATRRAGEQASLARKRKAVQEVFVSLRSLYEFCESKFGDEDGEDEKALAHNDKMLATWLARLQEEFVNKMSL
ncbi:muts domain V-domain-containing protein [Lipomyces tetrasporus]|uniref:Muts domain V-domain-containing protein n=1 Tax=Lipomyces tetrasporus TaxID=54092 RepID=A0AAD7VVA5_9ASCO|nr:muts domain V-domain-containing protein [Lipomyces tetrasporus]KAJ8102776.1 muts domain V-domain-containing protein [Lipomyces tetrasporus]